MSKYVLVKEFLKKLVEMLLAGGGPAGEIDAPGTPGETLLCWPMNGCGEGVFMLFPNAKNPELLVPVKNWNPVGWGLKGIAGDTLFCGGRTSSSFRTWNTSYERTLNVVV